MGSGDEFARRDACLTFGLAEYDPLYVSPSKCAEAIGTFLSAISPANTAVTALRYPYLTHAYHTSAPQLHHAIRDYALSRTA